MGMYTQVRGWLNVDSISFGDNNIVDIQSTLHKAQESFLDTEDRSWVCKDTVARKGGNGSAYIFFGTELKNYESEAEHWIEYLLQFFPNAEGRIDFQYEEETPEDDDSTSKYWLIYRSKVVEKGQCKTWCYGYGNSYKD